MANSTNRKINIWINDKQVTNSYKGITGAMRKARNELAQMTIGSKEYIAQTKKLKSLQKILDQHNMAQGRVARGWTKIKNEIKRIAVGNIIANAFTGMASKIGQAWNFVISKTGEAEQGITNVLTLLSDADVTKYSESLKKGSLEVQKLGFAQEDTNKALFDAVSAGVEAGDSIDFLKKSAVLAKGGVTDLGTATDGMTTIMNAYNLSMEEADNVMNGFFTAQKFGKTTVGELASNVGKSASIASMANMSYQELLATTALLTKKGISTDEAMTNIKGTLTALLKPGAEAEKMMRKLGIPVGATQLKAVGFTKTMEKLNEVAKKNPDLIAKIIPNVRGLSAVTALSGEGLEEYKEILNSVTNDIGKNSSLQKAYQKQMETLPNIIAKAKGELTALAVNLGQKLAPVIKKIVPLISGFTKRLIELVDFLTKFFNSSSDAGSAIIELKNNFVEVTTETYNLLRALNLVNEEGNLTANAFKGIGFIFKQILRPITNSLKGIGLVIKGLRQVLQLTGLVKNENILGLEALTERINELKASFVGMTKIQKDFVEKVYFGLKKMYKDGKIDAKQYADALVRLKNEAMGIQDIKPLKTTKETTEFITTNYVEGNGSGKGKEVDKTKTSEDLYAKYLKVYENYVKKIDKLNADLDLSNKTSFEKEINQLHAKKDAMFEATSNAIKDLENKKQLTGEEERLLDAFRRQQLDIENWFQENLISIKKRAGKEVENLLISEKEKEIQAVKDKYANALSIAKGHSDDMIALTQKMNEEIDAINKKYDDPTDPEWGGLKEKVRRIKEVADEMANIWSSYNQARANEEQAQLEEFERTNDKKKRILQRRLDFGLISETEHTHAVEKLDKELDLKKRKIAHDQAVREKQINTFKAVINTAAAVAEALPNYILAALVGIAGAAQIAAIQSEPIPAFAGGGRINKPTVGLVGEAGREIILSNSIVDDKNLGPIADDLARIQEGKTPNFLGEPAKPNFGGMTKAISGNPAIISQNSTTINQVDTQGMANLQNETSAMRNDIAEMTAVIKDMKYLKAIITQRELDERDTDEELLLRYSNF